jgi:NAD(P)-dependent dehydrogenase (short-subunit alcohol dehydrogenase family)
MQDAVVVITGASSGVGRACAREFARRGARIALIARGGHVPANSSVTAGARQA